MLFFTVRENKNLIDIHPVNVLIWDALVLESIGDYVLQLKKCYVLANF